MKTETEIQSEIREYLQLCGWTVYRMNSGRKGGMLLHRKGTPDLLAMRKGKSVFIEVKRPGYKPTKDQVEEHKRINDNGFAVVIADSIDAVTGLR